MFDFNSADENTLFNKVRAFFTIHSLVGLVVVVVLGMTAYAFYVYHNTAQQARLFSDLVSIQLTESMLHGETDGRRQYLDRLAAMPGIEKLHVFTSDAIAEQSGSSRETEAVLNATEKEVLRSGATRTQWLQHGMTSSLRVTRPLIASSPGGFDCPRCDKVQEGTVLGGISITFSAGDFVYVAIVYTLVLLVGLFMLISMRLLRSRFEPLTVVTDEISRIVERAVQGDFSGKLGRLTDDDVGALAGGVNQLMASLQQNIEGITTDISSLLNCEFVKQGSHNRLIVARDMVSSLVRISRFRKAIEADESECDVYRRLGAVLGEAFGIARYSIYEVDAQMNRMTPALIDAEENRDICYCDAQIQLRADACRVIRTGHAVNNFVSGKICSHYRGPEHHRHLCLPVRESGGDGGVLQMLISEGEQARIMAQRPYIDAYLHETGSVIETKRQLRHLRESSLRDPLTGLYNRRFLTEFENTLVATLQRRLTHAVILMVDLDYFKQVNDNYGHVSGDKVLKEMAWVMQQSVRGSDLVIRYGGEEFMLLLLDAEAVNGMKVAEKIRANVAKGNIKLAGGVVRNTVSIGVADYPGDSDDFWQCVRYADAALYQAKETGRNRVERYFAELLDEAVDY